LDEALPAALHCLKSPVLQQSGVIAVLPAAAKSLAALGRHDDALQIVETDFGPMTDALRQALRAYKLTALAVILHQLARPERLDHVAGIALTQHSSTDGLTVEINLAQVVGGDDALAALPTPTPADLAPDRIDALIAEMIAEIRNDAGPADAAPPKDAPPLPAI